MVLTEDNWKLLDFGSFNDLKTQEMFSSAQCWAKYDVGQLCACRKGLMWCRESRNTQVIQKKQEATEHWQMFLIQRFVAFVRLAVGLCVKRDDHQSQSVDSCRPAGFQLEAAQLSASPLLQTVIITNTSSWAQTLPTATDISDKIFPVAGPDPRLCEQAGDRAWTLITSILERQQSPHWSQCFDVL